MHLAGKQEFLAPEPVRTKADSWEAFLYGMKLDGDKHGQINAIRMLNYIEGEMIGLCIKDEELYCRLGSFCAYIGRYFEVLIHSLLVDVYCSLNQPTQSSILILLTFVSYLWL